MKNNLNNSFTLLIAEDDEDDYFLILEALKGLKLGNNVKRVKDGEELMEYLSHKPPFDSVKLHPLPSLIFLDLNMPKIDGREALKEIKSQDKLKNIPILVLTTSNSPEDIQFSYQYGANSYIQKPVNYDEFLEVFKTIQQYWLDVVVLPPA